MQNPYPVLIILLAGVVTSISFKKLTITAAITGGILGWLIYTGGGLRGLLFIAFFFILGTGATSWKKKEKSSIRANAEHQSTRTAGQVIANAGVAALAGLLAVLLPNWKGLFQLMMAGSMSAAMADTLSSELGMVYGRRFYHILTGKPDEKGQDGVISIEGLLIGIIGSAIIALIANDHFWVIVLAGTIGNLADSLLGALFERQGRISNNTVNLLNTLIGALAAGLLARIAA
ncbi:MAG TPA: DUF92 domain-containing protein [Puia sp.]|jgi:uncharacterized protein (TIGR00297 family)|nr:DUF92 domain-containing protein [Puia sp.]